MVIKAGSLFVQVRATGTRLVSNTSDNAITEDKIQLNLEMPNVIKNNISFDLNGGTGTAPATQSLEEGLLAVKPETSTREGYKFSEWNTTQDGKGTEWKFEETSMP